MLRRTSEPVSRVAANCGFDNVPYFTRSFKAAYGLSPASYRRTWSERAGAPDDQNPSHT